jgi:hypothetical protein
LREKAGRFWHWQLEEKAMEIKDDEVASTTKHIEIEGHYVAQQFDANGKHRLFINGLEVTEWRPYNRPVFAYKGQIVFVGLTAYYGVREQVMAFECINAVEAKSAVEILKLF